MDKHVCETRRSLRRVPRMRSATEPHPHRERRLTCGRRVATAYRTSESLGTGIAVRTECRQNLAFHRDRCTRLSDRNCRVKSNGVDLPNVPDLTFAGRRSRGGVRCSSLSNFLCCKALRRVSDDTRNGSVLPVAFRAAVGIVKAFGRTERGRESFVSRDSPR
jgi:hypothetical protein